MSNPNIRYRKDIDGLRAIAVSLVLIYHAGFSFLPGGFIGVDVFFVISGYLITGIIFPDIKGEKFSYTNFYHRRIRRLVPALIAVLFVSTVAAVFILLPNDLRSYSISMVLSFVGLSNIFFWRENGGYFAGNSQEVPLLNMWSLSVEEQFYVLWPLYLTLCYRYLPKKIFITVNVVFLISALLFSEWVTRTTYGAAYYLLPTRVFELMIGGLLALEWKNIPTISKRTNSTLSLIGLTLILSSAFILTKHDYFPGINALYACVGTALLIISGKHNPGIVNKLIENRLFIFIGLISYSLYLWHWPVIVFYQYTGHELTPIAGVLCILVSILLAYLTWKFVETPFRHVGHSNFWPTFRKMYLAPLSVGLLAALFLVLNKGVPSRFEDNILKMDHAIASKPATLRGKCHSSLRHSEVTPNESCILGDISIANINTFMIGDSHANHFTGMIDELGKIQKLKVNDYTMDDCLPIFDMEWGRNPYYADKCKARNNLSKQYIAAKKFDYIVLAGNWPKFGQTEYLHIKNKVISEHEAFKKVFSNKLNQTLEFIIKNNATPIIITSIPAMGGISPKCALIKSLFNEELDCNKPRTEVDLKNSFFDQIIYQLTEKYPQLVVINPKSITCDESTCYSKLNNVPLYLDAGHLNDEGSRLIGKKLVEQTKLFGEKSDI